jgi:hypothetical protein
MADPGESSRSPRDSRTVKNPKHPYPLEVMDPPSPHLRLDFHRAMPHTPSKSQDDSS